MPLISLVIITHNEERHIRGCLESALDIVDEVVVLDDFSTDNTKKILEEHHVIIHEKKMVGFGEQKRTAIRLASHDWILALDADERLSAELHKSLRQWKTNPCPGDAFYFHRLNYYCGEPIRHGGWYPDRKIRFWNRRKGNWTKDTVHEAVRMDPGAETRKLDGDILHFTMYTVEEHWARSRKYAHLQALAQANKPWFYLLSKLFFTPGFTFLQLYAFKMGFRDGWRGLAIAGITAVGKVWTYCGALRQKYQSMQSPTRS